MCEVYIVYLTERVNVPFDTCVRCVIYIVNLYNEGQMVLRNDVNVVCEKQNFL